MVAGSWQSQPIEIDGNSNDWPSPYPNYDSKSMVAYATSNDENYLYVSMETGDEMTQMKILKQGMNLLIDTTSGKNPQFTINYPMQNDHDLFDLPKPEKLQHASLGNEFKNKQSLSKIKKAASEATQYGLEGFGACNGGYMVSQVSPCGIKVKLAIDEYNELVWEAAIPLKLLASNGAAASSVIGKPISVCFSIKAFKKPDSKSSSSDDNGSSPMTSNRGIGGAGARGGGRGSNPKSAPINPLQQLYENTKTWKFFTLVPKP